jgi:hypothetical protein
MCPVIKITILLSMAIPIAIDNTVVENKAVREIKKIQFNIRILKIISFFMFI